ncbi:hypothetical protein H310_10424 [Aphanomyces invadans]|uniref:HTH psq-type domain-containing protein n=1 Tax=Aphanomyces invadans TaxID=157072 RepID=A0A024TQ18_9STRA|nr:hypothetical protein H310_10424 [Aphanomyces invadans]ETV96240.1 hypothetical protein H310_10424 [Aphanomyces invadans]|eukprot:XP_008875032.1 hypothetical protein H310_10424 [Aphanomyces invadans]
MSYKQPKRAPVHRSYREKQQAIRAWREIQGGDLTMKRFCVRRGFKVSTFEKWLQNEDKINKFRRRSRN